MSKFELGERGKFKWIRRGEICPLGRVGYCYFNGLCCIETEGILHLFLSGKMIFLRFQGYPKWHFRSSYQNSETTFKDKYLQVDTLETI